MRNYKIFLLFSIIAISVLGCKTHKTISKEVVQNVQTEQKIVVEEPSGLVIGSEVTIAPDIPEFVEFCGKKIKLDRYDMKERYDREMLSMLYMHSSSLLLIKRANRYFPVIEPILAAYGVPDDMKYLACIESHLDYKALSAAKAVGMWQFIPETAKEYGLEVNDEIDERYNIVKSTEAACRYLNYAYSLYGDWATAAASYNTGYARVSKELLRQKAGNGFDLWLVDETMRYVFRILTCKEFLKDPKKYGFYIKKENLYPPFITKDTVINTKISNWISFADTLGISFYDLKYFNTWIRSDSLLNIENKSYKVIYPVSDSRYYSNKKMPVHNKNWVTDSE